MIAACPGPADNLGVIRGVLAAVDCEVQGYSMQGYLALTGPDSFFPAALTSLLVIYVGLLGLRLMFGIGQTRLADAPVAAVKIGLILSIALNWTVFQTLVFDLASDAPYDVARVVSQPLQKSGSKLTADPIAGLQYVYDEIGANAEAFGRSAGPNPNLLQGGNAAAAQKLWDAQSTLFLGTVGVMSVSVIAIGILATIGPIFIALALLSGTTGLFFGWVRSLVGAAIVPMLSWTTTLILMLTLEPWLDDLARDRLASTLHHDTASTISLVINIFAAAQAALVVGALVIASGLTIGRWKASEAQRGNRSSVTASPVAGMSRTERIAHYAQRDMARAAPVFGPAQDRWVASSAAGVSQSGSPMGAVPIGLGMRRDVHLGRLGAQRLNRPTDKDRP